MESTTVLPTTKDRRIQDADAARSLWKKLRTASENRREKWAQIQNQLDGAPPFANEDLIASGQGWRCNVNFRDASSTLEQVLVSYWRLLHDTTNLAAVTVLDEDPQAERHEQIFQKNFNRFVDDWGADYVRNYLLMSQNHIAFGVGLAFFNDCYSPRWEAVRTGEIEVPMRAKASVEKLSVIGIRQEMEIDDLWKLVRNEEAKAAATTRGWNVTEIEELLTREFVNTDGSKSQPVPAGDVLEMQRLMRNNSLGMTTGHDPMRVVHLLVKDYDGKITRQIFCEGVEHNKHFIFDDSYGERPDSMNSVLGAVFFDAGNGDWWGAKGFGVKNFQVSTVLNRLKSRAVDRTLLDGLNFRDMSEGGRETVPITNIGPFNFLPKDVEQLANYPTGRSIIETIDMLESGQSHNNARYRDNSTQIAKTDTATQANILANLQTQVDVANATLYLRQIARSIFAEQFRRLRMRDNPCEDAKEFKKRCVEADGMDETFFHEAAIFIRTGADPGAANLALQGQKAIELLTQCPDANRRWAQEKYVAANFGAQAVSKALNPADASTEISAARLALMENSDMGEGNPLPVDPQDNHAAHVPVHIQPLEIITHNFDATGRIDPNALVALQNAVPHLEAHFEYMKSDKTQEKLYREFWPRFTAVRSAAEGIFRMVERMHNQATQQQQQGGLNPAAAVGASAPQ